jgi:hypothetical protein
VGSRGIFKGNSNINPSSNVINLGNITKGFSFPIYKYIIANLATPTPTPTTYILYLVDSPSLKSYTKC